jgi:uncharacterized protein YqcC (DUF446 family)
MHDINYYGMITLVWVLSPCASWSLLSAENVLSAAVAAATWLTWLVYRRIEKLMGQNNEILKATTAISASMLTEAKRARESHFAPLLFPRLTKIQISEPSVFFSDWKVENKGAGPAFRVTVTVPDHPSYSISPIDVGASVAAGPFQHSLTSAHPPTAADIEITLEYSDIFGNRFQTRFERSDIAFTAL